MSDALGVGGLAQSGPHAYVPCECWVLLLSFLAREQGPAGYEMGGGQQKLREALSDSQEAGQVAGFLQSSCWFLCFSVPDVGDVTFSTIKSS